MANSQAATVSPERWYRFGNAALFAIAALLLLSYGVGEAIRFNAHGDKGITAIIDMSGTVASALPPLIIIAAVGSQFSASVADFSGAEGLITEISHSKISPKQIFLFITVVTISLAWITDVTSIISLASRAFALFYSLQCTVAFEIPQKKQDLAHRIPQLALFGSMALVCLLVALFGVPAG